MWNLEEKTLEFTLAGHEKPVIEAAFSNDDNYIYSYGDDQKIILWNIEKKKEIEHMDAPVFFDCVVSNNGKDFFSITDKGDLIMWDFQLKNRVACIEGHKESVKYAIISKDNRFAVTAGADCTIRRWNLVKKSQDCIIKYYNSVRSMAITANSNYVLLEA